ncbi:MAG: tetratricopeptide repeat protein [Anaerolineae bacterium]|nr:tetratricopeptide repeat protein [Anaerolineae bacterium]
MTHLLRNDVWLKLVLVGVILGLLQISPLSLPLLNSVYLARQLSEEGEHALAGESFGVASLYQPWEPQHLTAAVRERLLINDEVGAQHDLERLTQLRPLLLDETLWLAAIYARQGRSGEASRLWDAAQAAGVLDADTLNRLADDAIRQQAWWEAGAALEGLTRLSPNDAQAFYRLGLVQSLDRPDQAVQSLAWAVTLDAQLASRLASLQTHLTERANQSPDQAYAHLGVCYISLGQYELAESALSRSYSYNVVYSEPLAYLAYARARLGLPALGAAQQAAAISPDNPLVNFLVGLTWKELDRTAEARAYFERARDLDGDNPAFAVEIAETYRIERAYEYAEMWMKEAVRVAPGDVRFRITLAQFYVDSEYKVESDGLPLTQQLVSEDPQNAQVRDILGWAYFLIGDLDRAFVEVSQALALDPELARAYVHMGTLLEARGQVPQAIQHYQRAIALDPHGTSGELARRALERLEDG